MEPEFTVVVRYKGKFLNEPDLNEKLGQDIQESLTENGVWWLQVIEVEGQP